MKKISACITLLLVFAASTNGQERKINFKPYGFFSNYGYFDSHASLQVAEGLFNIMPLDSEPDASGRDLNQVCSAKFLAITTRMGVDITSEESVLGALPHVRIETDFGGYSGSGTMLRLRQAYLELGWNSCNALVGQTWHPFSGDLRPDVFSLGTGSPFNPFNRSPQIRFDYRPNDCLTASAAAIWQFQYASVGLDGKSSASVARNAVLPELYTGINYIQDHFSFGGGVSYLTIKPLCTLVDADGLSHKTGSHCSGINLLAQGCYKAGLLTLKGKVVYGQNTSHLLQPSGYGVTYSDGRQIRYSPLHNISSWVTASYGEELRYGLLLGYFQNLGSAGQNFTGNIVMWGNHAGCPTSLDNVFRVNPLVTRRFGALTLGAEYEWTCAFYGTMHSNGRVRNTHPVSNHRAGILFRYDF